jgi:hypothetical protein
MDTLFEAAWDRQTIPRSQAREVGWADRGWGVERVAKGHEACGMSMLPDKLVRITRGTWMHARNSRSPLSNRRHASRELLDQERPAVHHRPV